MSILACHGYARGAFMGHSYGTSWVSYMVSQQNVLLYYTSIVLYRFFQNDSILPGRVFG